MILMISGKVNNWAFDTVPQAGLNGRIGYQPRGKGLGGSSAINAMVYIRGHRSDYDHWASLGNTGWSYADVLPYFKRSEDNSEFDGEYHGKGGPLHVTGLRSDNPVQRDLSAGRARGAVPDPRRFQWRGAGRPRHLPGDAEERRALERGARLHSSATWTTRPILRVETDAQATRILFEGKRAVGVEYRQGKETKQIRARREVILSSGAFQTPQLLMLSGVGDSAALAKHGIATTHHLPGVGQNLQDHPDFVFGFTSDAPLFRRPVVRRHRADLQGHRAIPARAARTDDLERRRMRRLPQDAARPRRARHPAAFLHGDGRTTTAASRAGAPGSPATSACCGPKAAAASGCKAPIRLQAPAIDPNFLGEDADLEAMVAGFKMTKRLLDAPALKALQTSDVFTAGVESDDDIRKVLRERVDTVYHPVGTCKMGVNDPMAVVDPKLRVYGLEGLRVVDASIMPTLIGGNTNAPTIMIGEKAADMIRRGDALTTTRRVVQNAPV